MTIPPVVEEEEEEEKQQYVLVSALYGIRNNKRRLHWVLAEKQKRKDWFLKGKPVDSLCGIHASGIGNDYSDTGIHDFMEYSEQEYIRDLQNDWEQGRIRSQRRVFDNILGRVRITEVTPELLESEMWCKQCQRKKTELYPNL